MSNYTEAAWNAAQKTTFKFTGPTTIEIMDASILWPDFTGKVTKLNKIKGEKRSFNLVLNDALIDALRTLENTTGTQFRIRQANVFSDNDVKERGVQQITMFYINVKVNVKNPNNLPDVRLYTTYKGKTSCSILGHALSDGSNDIDCLDSVDIEQCDITVNCYSNENWPEKRTMYLTRLWAKQNKQAVYDGRWDDYMNDDGTPDEDVRTAADINPATGEIENN